MPIAVHLDRLLAERGVTLTELATRIDITVANLSILKNNRARAIRFSTLEALCRELDCQPGELISYRPPELTRRRRRAAVRGSQTARDLSA
ncbi:MAG: transcriptional regulator [Pseudonocardiales bacterium]|nr:MAG: transcriptional regulator [Pseudonocardiales bacterium]